MSNTNIIITIVHLFNLLCSKRSRKLLLSVNWFGIFFFVFDDHHQNDIRLSSVMKGNPLEGWSIIFHHFENSRWHGLIVCKITSDDVLYTVEFWCFFSSWKKIVFHVIYIRCFWPLSNVSFWTWIEFGWFWTKWDFDWRVNTSILNSIAFACQNK